MRQEICRLKDERSIWLEKKLIYMRAPQINDRSTV